MTLTGTYTAAGAALESKVSAGLCALRITRAAAAAGPTPDGAAALTNERQTLPILGTGRGGATFTVRAQLVAARAEAAYLLHEIGLYALDGGSEVLYRVYRLDEPLAIDPGTTLTAEFSLSESVLPGAEAEAVVSPAGLATVDQCAAILSGSFTRQGAAQSYSCAGAGLQALINELPRPLSHDVTVTVTDGAIPGSLNLFDLYGAGMLTILSTDGAAIQNTLRIENCRLTQLRFQNIHVGAGTLLPIEDTVEGLSGGTKCAVMVRFSENVVLKSMTVADPGTYDNSSVGFFFRRSGVTLRNWAAPRRYTAICGFDSARVYIQRAIHSDGAVGSMYMNMAVEDSIHFVGFSSATKYGATYSYQNKAGTWVHYNDGDYTLL